MKYILTDFNKSRWNGVNLENVKNKIDELNEIINNIGIIYGEFGDLTSFDITFKNVTHAIKNIEIKNGIVYGNVVFINDDIKEMYKSKKYQFGIRCRGENIGNDIIIHKIYTWDIIEK